jgi:hypothetical protein
MVRKLVMLGVAAVFTAGICGTALAAGNKCDAGVTKAAGKKVACRDGVYAKGQAKGLAPDTAKLAKCDAKFGTICAKLSGCVKHTSCATQENVADGCSNALSPSGAFLNVSGSF